MDEIKGIKHGKSALVLAGGGLTGAVYHIGALRAIDDLLVDRTVNDFDIFVGTSAGSLICSLLANGFTPDQMLKSMYSGNSELGAIEQRHIFSVNFQDVLRWVVKIPPGIVKNAYQYLKSSREMTIFDLLWSLSEMVPPGLYDIMALEHYLRGVLETPGRSNDFVDLERELYLIATDLDSGERIVFGRGENESVPISLAMAASSALPLLYRPVQIEGKEYVDGGLRGTASLDLAVERGAELVVCINPLVPYDKSRRSNVPHPLLGEGRLSEKGIRLVSDQVVRIISHAGLHYHIKQLRRRHPEVDIILIEPRPDDDQMFFHNIMHYSARLIVARHGFEAVTLDLAEDYPRYKSILARHGIPISRRLVIEELAEIQQSGYDPEVIRRVLEARSNACRRGKGDNPTCQLQKTLAELDLVLETLPAESQVFSRPG
jgi:predicted acylesterase/phospholipase RssA